MITQFYRVEDVSLILDMSKSQIYRLISEGQLPALRTGKSVRVKEEDLEAWIEEHMDSDGSENTEGGHKALQTV